VDIFKESAYPKFALAMECLAQFDVLHVNNAFNVAAELREIS